MPEPSEHRLEAGLRAWAKHRRDQAGKEFELHPATRRLLRDEVRRTFPPRDTETAGPAKFSLGLFWSRTLSVLGVFLVIGLAGWAVKVVWSNLPRYGDTAMDDLNPPKQVAFTLRRSPDAAPGQSGAQGVPAETETNEIFNLAQLKGSSVDRLAAAATPPVRRNQSPDQPGSTVVAGEVRTVANPFAIGPGAPAPNEGLVFRPSAPSTAGVAALTESLGRRTSRTLGGAGAPQEVAQAKPPPATPAAPAPPPQSRPTPAAKPEVVTVPGTTPPVVVASTRTADSPIEEPKPLAQRPVDLAATPVPAPSVALANQPARTSDRTLEDAKLVKTANGSEKVAESKLVVNDIDSSTTLAMRGTASPAGRPLLSPALGAPPVAAGALTRSDYFLDGAARPRFLRPSGGDKALRDFSLHIDGEHVIVTDADGSTYTGLLVSGSRPGTLRPAGGRGAEALRSGPVVRSSGSGSAGRGREIMEPDHYDFQVIGTNRSSGLVVQLSGVFVREQQPVEAQTRAKAGEMDPYFAMSRPMGAAPAGLRGANTNRAAVLALVNAQSIRGVLRVGTNEPQSFEAIRSW